MATTASAIASIVTGGVADIIKLFKVDPNLALQNQTELTKIAADLQGKIIDQITAQVEVNKVEAASNKIFIAGWRPFVGWVCGSALAYAFILQPFIQFILVTAKVNFDATKLPALELGQLLPILLGMLGLAGARTYEKTKGIDSGH